MKNIFRAASLVILFIPFIIIPLNTNAEDGVTLRDTGEPKGGTPVEQMSSKDWTDPQELKRTWDGAKVRIPLETGVIKASMINLRNVPTEKKFPTVIYMHGCNGFWTGTDRRVDFLATLQFAAIAPNSFARKKVPTSCEPLTHKAGMYRATLIMRQNEVAYAIREACKLAWVDSKNIILMGHSEGGITTATFTGESVKARIIEGWGCHASWPEYHGLNALKTEPVLSIIGDKDPWLSNLALQGDCGEFTLNEASESIVFKSGYIRYEHFLLEYPEAKALVRKFLKKNSN